MVCRSHCPLAVPWLRGFLRRHRLPYPSLLLSPSRKTSGYPAFGYETNSDAHVTSHPHHVFSHDQNLPSGTNCLRPPDHKRVLELNCIRGIKVYTARKTRYGIRRFASMGRLFRSVLRGQDIPHWKRKRHSAKSPPSKRCFQSRSSGYPHSSPRLHETASGQPIGKDQAAGADGGGQDCGGGRSRQRRIATAEDRGHGELRRRRIAAAVDWRGRIAAEDSEHFQLLSA
jgi:hypothetical protein